MIAVIKYRCTLDKEVFELVFDEKGNWAQTLRNLHRRYGAGFGIQKGLPSLAG
jgi:hypothetical protein